MNSRRTDQMDVYLMEFDVLRARAEARMATGSGFPDEFAPIRCMRNAGISKNGKSLVSASIQYATALPAAANQMRPRCAARCIIGCRFGFRHGGGGLCCMRGISYGEKREEKGEEMRIAATQEGAKIGRRGAL